MAFNLSKELTGNKIVEDFTNSLNQIIGKVSGAKPASKGGLLFRKDYGGASDFNSALWTGNTKNPAQVKYGFAVLTRDNLNTTNINKSSWPGAQNMASLVLGDPGVFYFQIPPRSIKQRELFANNIQATRRGVIVESEGVVFKEITLQGTTGVFPGIRGSANNPTANSSDFTQAPKGPQGVDSKLGTSTSSGVTTLTGYEEFLRLRQFFLRYAKTKLDRDGDLFLVWINQKDYETLIVEPMDFIMDRNAKSPLTYDYTIVLRSIGNLNSVFSSEDSKSELTFFQKAANVSANVSATIATGRAVFNQSTRLLQRITQAVDETFNGPLRQLQYASEDVASGIATTLSLPSILLNNNSQAIAGIRDSMSSLSATLLPSIPKDDKLRKDVVQDSSLRADAAASASFEMQTQDAIVNDARVPLPKSFVQDLKNVTLELSHNVADYANLGDSSFDDIKNRISTITPDSLKSVSDEEFLLLGNLLSVADSLNNALATNALFASDAEEAFKNAKAPFESPDLPPEFQVNMQSPNSVHEITILQGDTLERIAQRYLGDALRWTELVILNVLKPPYISAQGGDGIKKYGDKLLIGLY